MSIKGTRINKGTIVELDEAYASSLGNDVSLIGEIKKPEVVPVLQVGIEKMSKQELVDLCVKEGLSASGNKSDLLERLQLHYQPNLS